MNFLIDLLIESRPDPYKIDDFARIASELRNLLVSARSGPVDTSN